jgi:hypothetical protein
MMKQEPFFIAFEGPAESVAVLRRFVSAVAAAKVANSDGSLVVEDRESVIADPKWIGLLDPTSVGRLNRNGNWSLDDILDCMLSAEYELLDVAFSDSTGRLLYDPLAFPFGGTDPLKALVEITGLHVTGDSFYDGAAT